MAAFWNAGTITLTTNSAAVTGQGTDFLGSTARAGDTIESDDGRRATIASINSATSITLDKPWRGAGQSAAAYKIWFTPDDVTLEGLGRRALSNLSSGNVTALAGLPLAENKGIHATGEGTLATHDLTAKGREIIGATNNAAARTAIGLPDLGIGDRGTISNANNALPGSFMSFQGTEAEAVAANFPALGGASTTPRWWNVLTGSGGSRATQIAQEIYGIGVAGGKGRLFTRVCHDTWSAWTPVIRGVDKALLGLVASDVGLGNVNNTSDASKPISTAQQTALNAKANLAGPSFTGNVSVQSGSGRTLELMQSGFVSLVLHAIGSVRKFMSLSGTTGSFVWEDQGGAVHMSLSTNGNLAVTGSLSKASGTFLIDHPVDPLNKDLAHGFVEAPRYDLIYRGVAKLVNGRALVDIDAASNMSDGTFAALTTNAVVTSLQNQDGFARVRSGEIDGGLFDIVCEDDTSVDAIAWVVIAERNDPFIRSDLEPNTDDNGRFVPEREKPE